MDFSTRNNQTQAGAPQAAPAPGRKNKGAGNKLARIGTLLIGAAVIILLVAIVALISFGGDKKESEYVDSSKLQAVFLNTGQVYFGNIETLNNQHIVLTNIYYLQTANNGQNNSNTSVSLVKLGCELHEPFDQMIINQDQVTFWENLQDNGQVAKAVSTFEKQNPNGQKCADQSSSASNNSGSNAQNAGSSNSNSNNNTTNNNSNN